jgi:2Fe-2S ferredoxin
MPTITFICHNGQSSEVLAQTGDSLMETATFNGVMGVVAECGGACSCATCHVYIDPDWYAKLPVPDESEKEMLEFAIDPRKNSRLSCQVEITEELDGMVVHTPENQY